MPEMTWTRTRTLPDRGDAQAVDGHASTNSTTVMHSFSDTVMPTLYLMSVYIIQEFVTALVNAT